MPNILNTLWTKESIVSIDQRSAFLFFFVFFFCNGQGIIAAHGLHDSFGEDSKPWKDWWIDIFREKNLWHDNFRIDKTKMRIHFLIKKKKNSPCSVFRTAAESLYLFSQEYSKRRAFLFGKLSFLISLHPK